MDDALNHPANSGGVFQNTRLVAMTQAKAHSCRALPLGGADQASLEGYLELLHGIFSDWDARFLTSVLRVDSSGTPGFALRTDMTRRVCQP
jgi:hypothetical protein